MDAFDSFKKRNESVFKDMGLDSNNLRFKPTGPNLDASFKYGEMLKDMAKSDTFPASIIDSKPLVKDPFASS